MGFLEILLLPRINQFQWQYTPKKVVNKAGGLQMSSLSFAKFGLLYKNKGIWNKDLIIPEK